MAKIKAIVALATTWMGCCSVLLGQESPTGGAPLAPPSMAPPGMVAPPPSPIPGGVSSAPPMMDPGFVPIGVQFTVEPFVLWYSPARLPVTMTTGDPATSIRPGSLGEPGTVILNGGNEFVGAAAPGLRLQMSRTFGCEEEWSFDASGFLVQHRNRIYDFASNAGGTPVVARPFFNAVALAEDADLRAFPATFSGAAHDEFRTQLYGAEGNIRLEFASPESGRFLGLTALIGPRYFVLDEAYSNYDVATELPNGVGNTYRFADSFGTRNQFVGGHIGGTVRGTIKNLSFDVTGKFLGGVNHQRLDISGFTAVTDAAGVSAVDNQQGLFAMPSNVGRWSRNRAAFGGEMNLKWGIRFSDHFRFTFGYTFFAIQNIVRPGDQIDRTVNIQPLFSGGGLGVARPAPTFRETMLSTHAINFGFEWLF